MITQKQARFAQSTVEQPQETITVELPLHIVRGAIVEAYRTRVIYQLEFPTPYQIVLLELIGAALMSSPEDVLGADYKAELDRYLTRKIGGQ